MAEFNITNSKIGQITDSGTNIQVTGNKGTVAIAGQTATANDPTLVLAAVRTIVECLPALNMPVAERSVIEADAKAAEAQLASPAPKHGIVKGLLKGVVGKVKETLITDAAAKTVVGLESALQTVTDDLASSIT